MPISFLNLLLLSTSFHHTLNGQSCACLFFLVIGCIFSSSNHNLIMPTLDPSEFSVFAGPGLFAIFNLNSRTALDLHYGDPKPDTAFEGWYVSSRTPNQNMTNICLLSHRSFGDSYDVTNPHQLFQIASVGEGKYILINQKTGSYVAAKGMSSSNPEMTMGKKHY